MILIYVYDRLDAADNETVSQLTHQLRVVVMTTLHRLLQQCIEVNCNLITDVTPIPGHHQ